MHHALLVLALQLDTQRLCRVDIDQVDGRHGNIGVERIHRGIPGQAGAVPLPELGALVELVHLGMVVRIGPVEVRRVRGRHFRGVALLADLQQQAAHGGGCHRTQDTGVFHLREDLGRLQEGINPVPDMVGKNVANAVEGMVHFRKSSSSVFCRYLQQRKSDVPPITPPGERPPARQDPTVGQCRPAHSWPPAPAAAGSWAPAFPPRPIPA